MGEQEEQHEIRPGDIVYIAPDEKHWHGAGRNSFMAHIAINLSVSGKPTNWMEKVTDTEYKSGFD